MIFPEWFQMEHLIGNPAKRYQIQRLNYNKQKAFLELLATPERDRTAQQLFRSGVVRPDLCIDDFQQTWNDFVEDDLKEHYLSNRFLQTWLTRGYISLNEIRHSQKCQEGQLEHRCNCDNRDFVNMACAIVDDGGCVLYDCYLPYAQFDNTTFYKAVIDNCVLDGVTAFDSSFKRCRGFFFGGTNLTIEEALQKLKLDYQSNC
jgi:hypothetical protein